MLFLLNGLFLDIGLEELLLLGVGLWVNNVEMEVLFDVGMFFGVEFVVVWYCKIGLEIFVLFWEIWLEELILLFGVFELEVFFFDSEDEWNNKDCIDLVGIFVGIFFELFIIIFFIFFLVIFNGDILFDDVCDVKSGLVVVLLFDICCEL